MAFFYVCDTMHTQCWLSCQYHNTYKNKHSIETQCFREISTQTIYKYCSFSTGLSGSYWETPMFSCGHLTADMIMNHI